MSSKQVHFVNRQKGTEKTIYPNAVKTTKFREIIEEPFSTQILKSSRTRQVIKAPSQLSQPPPPPSVSHTSKPPPPPPSSTSGSATTSHTVKTTTVRKSITGPPPPPRPAPPAAPSVAPTIKSHVRVSPQGSQLDDPVRLRVKTSPSSTSQDAINVSLKAAPATESSVVVRVKSPPKPPPSKAASSKAPTVVAPARPPPPPAPASTAPSTAATSTVSLATGRRSNAPAAQTQPPTQSLTIQVQEPYPTTDTVRISIRTRPEPTPLQLTKTTTYGFANASITTTTTQQLYPSTTTITIPSGGDSVSNTAVTLDTYDMSVLARIATAKVVMLPGGGREMVDESRGKGPKMVEIQSPTTRRREEWRHVEWERERARRPSVVDYEREVQLVRERWDRDGRRGSVASSVSSSGAGGSPRRGSREVRNGEGKVVLIVGDLKR